MAVLEVVSDNLSVIAAQDAVMPLRHRAMSAQLQWFFGTFVLLCAGVIGVQQVDLRSPDYSIAAAVPQKNEELPKLVPLVVAPIADRLVEKSTNAALDTASSLGSLLNPRALGYPPGAFRQSVQNHAKFEPDSLLRIGPVISTRRSPTLVSSLMVEGSHVPTTTLSADLSGLAPTNAGSALDRSHNASAPADFVAPQHAPVPMPRPHDVSPPAGRATFYPSWRHLAKYDRAAPLSAIADNRNFLEKLFGFQQPPGPTLAYASPEDGVFASSRSAASRTFSPEDGTAIYDISAHSVFLPNGSALEAHSGLGPMLDDPRTAGAKDRGVIPPQVYNLTLRESLFHGVQALRLSPVGSGSVYGRDGFLAHTYMLGPRGDSNGCISFRDYPAFLQAFQRGQVKRLIVVAQR